MAEVAKIIDLRRLVLFTDGVDGKRARFQFCVREGYPRITVFTGARGREGVISGPMDVEGFLVFTRYLRDIARGEKGSKIAIDLKTAIYEDNKPTDRMQLLSTLFCGKDDEGLVWLGLQSEGRPKLKFTFKISDYMVFRKSDGSAPSQAEMSSIAAESYANLLDAVMAQYSLQYSQQHALTPGTAIGATAPKTGIVSGAELEDIEF